MADRIVSIQDMKDFIPNGNSIVADGDIEKVLITLIEDVTDRFADYLGVVSLKQSSPVEFYGSEHYGHMDRNTIRLKRYLNVSSVTEIFDGNALDSSSFLLDAEQGIIYLLAQRKFTDSVKEVRVTYTAGFAETDPSDENLRKLAVTSALAGAAKKQILVEWALARPGGGEYGALSTGTSQGGNVSNITDEFIPQVMGALRRIRRVR